MENLRDVQCRFSPYEILDVEVDASPEIIKKKYKQLSLCEHSDPPEGL